MTTLLEGGKPTYDELAEQNAELLAAVKLLYQRIPSELVRNCGHIEALIAELCATP